MRLGLRRPIDWIVPIAALAAAAGIVAFLATSWHGENFSSGPAATQPAGEAAEAWASQPPQAWPQIVLTNRATFREHSDLEGASGFLIRTDDGRVLAATARHLIGPAGGVEPRISLPTLDAAMISWVMYPRTRPLETVELDRLALIEEPRPQHDWLLLSTRPREHWPAYPLRPRHARAQVGEDVFLVGVPYSEPKSPQNVYRGKVLRRERDDWFRYSVNPVVELRGFSGAPILDSDGFVLRVMSFSFEPRQQDGKELEGGAQDIETALEKLKPSRK